VEDGLVYPDPWPLGEHLLSSLALSILEPVSH
jgi:hypothetical protein